ncbi:MAG: peptidoglycan-binding domain-containing protein [Hyphomonadaceae bacterium]|nr:peptidoglycan-binding domain-containing protein [Hyphomonadaceae bacterium]
MVGFAKIWGAAVTVVLLTSGAAGAQAPEARPGQCFARVTIPAVMEVYSEERIVTPARTEERVIPPRYEVVDVQVLVSEPRTEQVVVPGVYRTFTETEVVTPERVEPVVIPARWETYAERVLVRPAYVTWKPGDNLFGRPATAAPAGAETDLLCRVEVPAEYAQVTRRRVVTPERTTTRTIPAVTRQVTRRELVSPARVEARVVPAQYRTVKDRRLVSPETVETVVIPEVRRTEQLQRIVSPARMEWREVLCGTNASRAKLAAVQRALSARGYPTASDGVFGPATLRAMEAFQRANNLAVGYLTIETVTALGVAPS